MSITSPIVEVRVQGSAYLRPLLVVAAGLAFLIYISALFSTTYFAPGPLAGRPLTLLMFLSEKMSAEVLPFAELASWIGAAAGILATLFSMVLVVRAWHSDAGKLLAMSLTVTAMGFGLLHYFPFVIDLRTAAVWLDAVLQVTGVVLIVCGGILWVRWTGLYPQPLTWSIYKPPIASWFRPGSRKSRTHRTLRIAKVRLYRWKRIEARFYRRYFGKLSIMFGDLAFHPSREEFKFIHRVATERWMYGICAIVAIATLASVFVDGFLQEAIMGARDGTLLVFLVTFLIVSNECLWSSYAATDEVGRRKILWIWLLPSIVYALLAFGWMVFFFFSFSDNSEMVGLIYKFELPLYPMVGIAIVLAVMISVLSRGAIDPRLAISRTTVYGLIAIIMTSLFVAIEALLSTQAALQFGLPNQTGAIITGVVATLVFSPVRNRIETGVSNWIRRVLPPSNLVEGDKRHSAVAFNDLSGYTKLSETDERQALTVAAVFHREAFSIVAAHGGRVVKTIGDAAMLEFASVPVLVKALRELHRNFVVACHRLRVEPLPIHSGVHYGEVFRGHDGDIYGQTVNLAARLEAVAGEGEIVLSEEAWQQLPERGGFQAMGERKLKNVAAPVNCFCLATNG